MVKKRKVRKRKSKTPLENSLKSEELTQNFKKIIDEKYKKINKEKEYIQKTNKLKKRKTIFFSLFIALIISLIIWNMDSPFPLEPTFQQKTNISENTSEFVIPVGFSPGYFSSVGKVYAIAGSPYLKDFDHISLELSTNKIEWKEIEILNRIPIHKDNMTYVGFIDLSNPSNFIYGRMETPKAILIPDGKTKEELLDSFKAGLKVEPVKTVEDYILLLIIFITTFGTTLTLFSILKTS